VNNCLAFNFMLPKGWIEIVANSLPVQSYIAFMVTGRLGPDLPPYCGMDP
jgi:hypothetical protein